MWLNYTLLYAEMCPLIIVIMIGVVFGNNHCILQNHNIMSQISVDLTNDMIDK